MREITAVDQHTCHIYLLSNGDAPNQRTIISEPGRTFTAIRLLGVVGRLVGVLPASNRLLAVVVLTPGLGLGRGLGRVVVAVFAD